MEKIKQITGTQKSAYLWSAIAVFATILLFLCSGKVYARETVMDVFNDYTEQQGIAKGTYLGWDQQSDSTILYGIWQDTSDTAPYYVALTMNGEDTVSECKKLDSEDIQITTEFFAPNYSDDGTWLDDTLYMTELNGEQRVVLPCYDEVQYCPVMIYKNTTIPLASEVEIISDDEEVVCVNESYEDDEISSVLGCSAGTANLTCIIKTADGDTISTQTIPCDVVNIELGRQKARYEGYGICVLPSADVELWAKTDGLDAYIEQGLVSYKWSATDNIGIDGKATQMIQFTAPATEIETDISVDVYINNRKFTTASAYLKVQNCDLDFTIYERTPTSLTSQSTTSPLYVNKQYLFVLKNGKFGWDCGNDETAPFSAWEFTMNGETFTINDIISEDYNTPIKQPSFMTYQRGIAGDDVPNSTITLKKSGTLKIKAMIYQNNKVFREVEQTFNVQGNSSETTQKPQQTTPSPKQNVSLKQGTKITDKKSKVVYKVNGNNTVEYNKANKKSKKVTVPSTITLNGINYQVTSIAAKSFANNKNLKKVIIPATVRNIGKQAFSGCKNLKNITIKTSYLTKKSVGAKAFKGIHAKATIKVPKKQKKAYQKFLKAKGIGKNVKIK